MATIKDKATGTQFPSSFSFPGLAGTLSALGAGCREKKVVMVTVHVYSVACHVDPAPAKAALAEFSGKANLVKDEKFFAALQGGSFETAFSLVFARDLSHEQFSNGIKESLEPILKAKKASPDALTAFVATLEGLTYTTGSRVYIAISGDKTLVAGVPKADVPADLSVPASVSSKEVASPELVSALKELYFGKSSVSPSLKAAVAEGLADFLK